MSQKGAKRARKAERVGPPTSSKGAGIPRRWLYGGLGAAVVALVVVLIVVSLSGGSEPATPSTIDATQTEKLLQGIPQDGISLGDPDAPVVLAEFADLQCPYCQEFQIQVMPKVIENYVRTGKVRIEFHGLAFIGTDSEKALRYALAAGDQNLLWYVTDLLYANQGDENSGWVTDELLAGIGAATPGLDTAAVDASVDSDAVSKQIQDAASLAEQKLPAITTPSFLIGRNGGELTHLDLKKRDYETVAAKIDELLAG